MFSWDRDYKVRTFSIKHYRTVYGPFTAILAPQRFKEIQEWRYPLSDGDLPTPNENNDNFNVCLQTDTFQIEFSRMDLLIAKWEKLKHLSIHYFWIILRRFCVCADCQPVKWLCVCVLCCGAQLTSVTARSRGCPATVAVALCWTWRHAAVVVQSSLQLVLLNMYIHVFPCLQFSYLLSSEVCIY